MKCISSGSGICGFRSFIIVAKIAPRIPPVKNEVRFSFVVVFVLFKDSKGFSEGAAALLFKFRNFDFAASKKNF